MDEEVLEKKYLIIFMNKKQEEHLQYHKKLWVLMKI